MRSEYGLSKVQESGLPDWTDGYDIAEFIDENGLDYDSIILDEGGDLVDGKPVSHGFSYVIRSSEQVKSADPITYDDSGKDYGTGVILDSTLLDNLSPDERVDMVKEYEKSLVDSLLRHLTKTEKRSASELPRQGKNSEIKKEKKSRSTST